MKTRYLMIILVIGITMSSHVQAKDWELYATSGDTVAMKTCVLLIWSAKHGVAGFNLYRKESAEGSYPDVPLNSKPMSVMTDCNEIKNIIPPTSEEWQKLSQALGITGTYKLEDGSIIPISKPFDPCNLATVTPSDTASFQKLQALAHAYWKISLVMGQAYLDSNVIVGATYWYEIRGVNKRGIEIGVLDTDVKVTAGEITPLPGPTGVSAEPGDAKVQITWKKVRGGVGYDIYRETSTALIPIKINKSVVVTQCTTNLVGKKIHEVNCYVDFQHWDEKTGKPLKHVVDGVSIDGPYNGTKYYYQVGARDILGRPGSLSTWVSAIPQDKTPPSVPSNVGVIPHTDGLESKWLKVTHDADGHLELGGIKGYFVYRFLSSDSLKDSIKVSGLIPDTFGTFITFKDTDPKLRSEYGEKDYWYRVRCVDSAGNISPLSVAASGHLPDTTPPSPPRELSARGDTLYIALKWKKPNPIPPDLAGYMLYRGVCGGDSVVVYRVGDRDIKAYQLYPLYPLGYIDDPDTVQYEDYKVPKTSPICYRYAVKAYDKSQNLSDTCRTVCERLREKTPPPPPVLSSLKARNRAIKVEWVAPPVQDLFGFMVERSGTVTGPWEQVSDSLKFPAVVNCESIPATNIWAANTTFSFLDTTVVPKQTYWYRIKAADYGGNIGKPSVPIETYTFDFTGPSQPTNLSVVQPSGQCALKITWNPRYDTAYFGFAVFRSSTKDFGYRQISPIIQGNEFIDDKIVAGKTYWYKVQHFGKDGNRSLASSPKSGMATQ